MEIKANIDGRMTIQRADAIKAYLHALYATPDYIFNNSLSDFKLKNAPPSIQNNINDFIMGIRGVMAIPEPDGKPRPEWKVFYGKTWEEARMQRIKKRWTTKKLPESMAEHRPKRNVHSPEQPEVTVMLIFAPSSK